MRLLWRLKVLWVKQGSMLLLCCQDLNEVCGGHSWGRAVEARTFRHLLPLQLSFRGLFSTKKNRKLSSFKWKKWPNLDTERILMNCFVSYIFWCVKCPGLFCRLQWWQRATFISVFFSDCNLCSISFCVLAILGQEVLNPGLFWIIFFMFWPDLKLPFGMCCFFV